MTGTDWLTATGILLSGAVIGFMVLYATTRRQSAAATPARPVALRDLEAKLDALIAQLRELHDTGGSAEEISRLEQEAANVLRQLDGVAQPVASRESRVASRVAAPAAAPASALKGFLWGVGSAAAIAGLVFFVVNQAKSRDTGGSVTGGTTETANRESRTANREQTDPDLQRLEAAVQASPDDLDARDNLAHAYLERENMVAAFEQAQTVLQKAPADARANTVQGIVRIAMGEAEQASKQLEAATKTDPKYVDGWVALAWAYTQTGRDAEAGKAIDSAVKQNPAQEARLREVLTKMRDQAKQRPAAASAPASAPPTAPAAAGGAAVKVTLSLAPGAKAPASNVLYIIVRDAGQTAGPPSAVKKVMVTSFPLTVDVTAADSMMGQPLPAKMRIEARLDTDGNAMTKEPTDLAASKDGVAAGGAVALTLAPGHS